MASKSASKKQQKNLKEDTAFGKLLAESGLKIPKVGDAVTGKIISSSRREVRIDLEGVTTGVVRGRELFAESALYKELKDGDEVEATVIDLENEHGEMELSFRFAGQQRAWADLQGFFASGETVPVKILEANKGGLIVQVSHIVGFLPVSQLSPDHYPRVTGGDKNKILEKLKSYVDESMDVRVIDVNERENKLIVSEKAVWEERQKDIISRFKVGDRVEGDVTALADFGAFIKFESLEGLVHISEIAWQRIDHPRDLLKVGDQAKAEIIGIEGSKIFLSMKKLIQDPWTGVQEKYQVGETVQGKVLKINPFGFFVELDPEIHGLAHVSELSAKPVADVHTIAKPGDVLDFKIVSIEPREHRLGLSIKALSESTGSKAEPASVPAEPAAS
ncbi:S1 RNA-binding domain-containing protein [Candidatus Uhrbacteria bacterium]|nr:S1 RNA-binding domain-containing protein [Candidatus Uhrbacteria bacterium]